MFIFFVFPVFDLDLLSVSEPDDLNDHFSQLETVCFEPPYLGPSSSSSLTIYDSLHARGMCICKKLLLLLAPLLNVAGDDSVLSTQLDFFVTA